MKALRRLVCFVCLGALGFTGGCAQDGGGGDDGDAATSPEEGENSLVFSQPLAVQSEQTLPDCVAANEDQLVFVESDNSFRTCRQGEWQLIDLKIGETVKEMVNVASETPGTNCPAGGYVIVTRLGLVATQDASGEERRYVCNGTSGSITRVEASTDTSETLE